MAKELMLLLVPISFLILFFPAVSADCSPHEVYSVSSVSQVDGWILVEVSHWSYICEMIAGEWVERVDTVNSYLILTDGRKAFLVGGFGPPLDWTMPAGFLNDTLYAVRISTYRETYKNVTFTVNGKSRSFPLMRNVRVEKIYRFKDDCFELVSKCIDITYPNGTSLKNCNDTLIKLLEPPTSKVHGRSLGVVNSSLTAFKAKNGVVLVNESVITVSISMSIRDVPLIFGIENGTIVKLPIEPLQKITCNKTRTGTNIPSTSSNLTKICGSGFVLVLLLLSLMLKGGS
ncbi:hypothetical protein PFDSM3638_04440 [Pyrococcus furiosus DSM 3638]|uniref:Uncharacterized protein n=3 Tax=Pyrococcus furiosus TaxID=2261 RepID=A0A5C0XNM4_PYRFU|nr:MULTISPECIES: hypothetical protein [Pyrococcus]AAL81012.1 hypothetical protein PF0888 [Pyrococcus furiosus DSM 3638]AFN03679.1 hypothetical protein PFC_03650 [Pyrococcus furiosus COM1]MDK2869780.1 hypothetical protein [Pyrococcus sp.]QEK78557.1 hypothetical protein PFDSM3638_04440 [Pyrococcus furiosus DSM 3638]